jgi:hypothetical protein
MIFSRLVSVNYTIQPEKGSEKLVISAASGRQFLLDDGKNPQTPIVRARWTSKDCGYLQWDSTSNA